MNHCKIVFFDIDGTLVLPDHSIQDSTKKAIGCLQKKGIDTVLATGRPIHEILHIAKELGIESYIGYNGGLAIYRGAEVYSRPLDKDVVMNLYQTVMAQGDQAVFYTASSNCFTDLEHKNVKGFIDCFHLRKNKAFTTDILEEVLGATLIAKLNDSLHSYNSGDGVHFSQVNIEGMEHCFDVIQDEVNKGVCIEMMLKKLGISPDHAAAFGDGMNDKEMLASVRHSVAMANANPALFAYARHRTSSVTDSGVYNGLKSLGLLDDID